MSELTFQVATRTAATVPRVNLGTAIGIPLAAGSATLANIAYLREHDAAAAMPALSMRRPLHSLHLLLSDHGWLLGFAMETGGFLLYAAALALAPLALVQSIGAGGIGVLAYVSSRVTGKPLGRRRQIGVWLSILGLVALGVSLAKASGNGHHGSIAGIAAWLGGTAACRRAGAADRAQARLARRRTGDRRRPAVLDRGHLDEAR